MGKTKKKKFRAPKPKPTGLTSVKDVETELETEFTSQNSIASVVEELQSVNVETRECGCSTLANLVNQKDAIPQLLQHNIVRIVAPLIVDASPHIRHVALGALRNLSVDGGHDVCEEMVSKDVLTPLVAFFKKHGTGWVPERKEKTKHKDSCEEVFTEAVHLLWNLCESSDLAVSVFNKENLIQCLVPCLQWEVYSYPTAVAVAHCLHAVTENNKMAATFCQAGDVMALLQKLIVPVENPESILLATLVTGIVMNVSDLSSSPSIPMSGVIQSLTNVLSLDALGVIISAAQNGGLNGVHDMAVSNSPGEAEADAVSEDLEPQGRLKEAEDILTAQQTGLEILANLCCSADDWEDVDGNESNSSDDMTVDVQMEDVDSQEFMPFSVPSEIHDSLLQHDTLSKVLSKAQPLEDDKKIVINNCPGGRKIVKSLLRVQTHALLCVNNMVNAMAASNMGGLGNLHKVWEGLVVLATSQQAKTELDLLEAVTSAMRAVIQKLAELESPKFSEITIADLEFLFAMSQQCSNTQVRVNALRCVATVGSLLSKIPQPHTLLKDIGNFLVEVVGRDAHLWVVAEALDSLFDVFGEDHVDPVVREIELVEKLSNILPLLKSRINSQRGSLGEHYPVISTARTNLIRFIKYKTSR